MSTRSPALGRLVAIALTFAVCIVVIAVAIRAAPWIAP